MCGERGTAWSCDAAECKYTYVYDVCVPCKAIMEVRRRLNPAIKKLVSARIPNCDDDPFLENDGGADWYAEYAVGRSGMLVSEVAAEVQVSIFSLIDHNGNINLEPSSPLRKGTTLWMPGPRPVDWVEPSLPAVLDDAEDDDSSLWDEDPGSEADVSADEGDDVSADEDEGDDVSADEDECGDDVSTDEDEDGDDEQNGQTWHQMDSTTDICGSCVSTVKVDN